MKKLILLIIFLYSTSFAFEIPQNERIDHWVKQFTTEKRGFFQRALNRSVLYRNDVLQVFRKHGLNSELSWLPLIESGFNCSARSLAKAAGCWQFVKKTGEAYNLKIDVWEDQRFNFYKSTIAAAKYLKYLRLKFKNTELALAAYNYGETRLRRKLKELKTNNFWDLKITDETMEYVPQFYATLIIVDDLKKYGFLLPENNYFRVTLKKGFHDLRYISRVLGVRYRRFSELNPGYRTGYTSPNNEVTLLLNKDWNYKILESFGLLAKKNQIKVN